ncbi:MAG: DUF4097 family beta strand repeat-containing protein [Ktedonobacterales bacterium]
MVTSVTETHELHLSGVPSLTVRSNAGNIRLHPGSEERILIIVTKRARGLLNAASEADLEKVNIDVRQSGNDVTVDAEVDRWSLFKQLTVDLDITLPADVTRLDLKLNAGNLEVEGIRGLIKAKVNAGNLDVLAGTTLADGSRLAANAGNVTIRSSIAPAASVEAEVNAGNLRLKLPRSTAVYVDARTHAGNVEVSGWSVNTARNFASASATGALAPGAKGTLTLRSNAGNIVLSPTE